MTIDISARTIIKIVLIFLSVFFVFILRDVIFVVLFSVFLAAAISPPISWLCKKRIPRLVSAVIIYVFFIALVSVFLTFVVPIIAGELSQLTQALPRYFENSIETASTSSRYLDFIAQLQAFLERASDYLEVSSGSITTLLVNIFGGLIYFISVFVISFYFSVMEHGVASFFKSIVPHVHEEYILGLWNRVNTKVGKWFQGQLLLALIIGIVVYVGPALLNVKYALLLGIVAMAFELIPFVGPIMASIPAIALAFLQRPLLALWVLLFYVIMQQLENQLLSPLILGKSTGMHPVSVIIALLIGGGLAGILGVLLAVPVAVVLVEGFEDLAQQRRTGLPT